MTARVLARTSGLSRAEWLGLRRQGLGGSDLAALVQGRFWPVYRAKTEGVEEPETEAMRWGRRLEDDVVEEVADRHPDWRITRRHAILVHPHEAWAIADLDRVVRTGGRDTGLLEIKTTARSWDDGVPAPIVAQAQHYLWVTGYPWAIVAVLHLGNRQYAEYTLPSDPDAQMRLRRVGAAFWRLVETRTPPPLDGSDAARAWLLQQYPAPRRPEPVDLPDEVAHAVDAYAAVGREIKQLEAERDRLGVQIRSALGDAPAGLTPTHRVVWVRSTRHQFDQQRLRQELPGIYDQYTAERLVDGGLRVSERKS